MTSKNNLHQLLGRRCRVLKLLGPLQLQTQEYVDWVSALAGVGQGVWRGVGEGLGKGWGRVGEGLGKGWRGVGEVGEGLVFYLSGLLNTNANRSAIATQFPKSHPCPRW